MTSLSREILTQTDDEIEAAFDAQGACLTVDDLSFTDETIADFLAARADWNESGTIRTNADGVLVIERAQPFKGARRRDVTVIDFGACRAVDGCDR